MKSIGFGLERIAWAAIGWPRLAAVLLTALVGMAVFGTSRLSFDEELRNVFASGSETYQAYTSVTGAFVDPENETLVLVEGEHLKDAANVGRLRAFQFELQLIDAVAGVHSPFALRDPPDANGNARLLVADEAAGLSEDLVRRIRAHPILGDKLLSADGRTMLFVVTPTRPRAPLSAARELKPRIDAVAATLFDGTDVQVTVSGFPTIRAEVVDVIRHDQIVLNVAGASIGIFVSLIVFRSLTAAALAAVPAILGGLTVLGFMGLTGTPVNVMSTVVPAVVMILGFADGMHLCFAWRHRRDTGSSVREAEVLAQREVGGACVLSAITTAVAFASLTISTVPTVRSFGIVGMIGVVAGTLIVLVAHGLLTLAVGRFWKHDARSSRNFFAWLEGPCGAVARYAVRYARPLTLVFLVLLIVLSAAHFSVPPQHSVGEHLPTQEAANAALRRIDQKLGGVYPVQVVVPLHGLSPTGPQALVRIGAVHRALAGVEGVSTPLSLWSLADWVGGAPEEASARIDGLLSGLGAAERARFLGDADAALVMTTIPERPTSEAIRLTDTIERVVKAAGGGDVVATGFTVLNAREGTRTISSLNGSLALSIVAELAIIAIAFRSIPFGIVAFLPNFLPVVTIGTILFLTHRGMQFSSAIALNVAFGIAVDDTVHFLNRLRLTAGSGSVADRIVDTARRIGPVLIGTTLIIIAGLSTTLTSGLPTVSLFGWIVGITLSVALIGDMVVLPALVAGFARRWFDRRPASSQVEEASA